MADDKEYPSYGDYIEPFITLTPDGNFHIVSPEDIEVGPGPLLDKVLLLEKILEGQGSTVEFPVDNNNFPHGEGCDNPYLVAELKPTRQVVILWGQEQEGTLWTNRYYCVACDKTYDPSVRPELPSKSSTLS